MDCNGNHYWPLKGCCLYIFTLCCLKCRLRIRKIICHGFLSIPLITELEIDLGNIGTGFLITVSASSEMVINDSALLDLVITLRIVSKQQLVYPVHSTPQKWMYFNPHVVKLCGSWLKAYIRWEHHFLVLLFILFTVFSLSNYSFFISPPIS